MALLRVNSLNGALTCPDDPTHDVIAILRDMLEELPAGVPIVILVHGYKFSPFSPRSNPHETLYSMVPDNPAKKIKSWPRQLGFHALDGRDGLCIAYGWHARKTRRLYTPFLDEVYNRAGREGKSLAQLVNWLRMLAPMRKIDIMAHSMGARVALQSTAHITGDNLGRVVMMGGAEFGAFALHALTARAAKSAEFYNVTTRQNDLYDWLFEQYAPRPGPQDRAIGAGFSFSLKNWIDIQIDNQDILDWFKAQSVEISPPQSRICHWSFYTRPGVFELYARLLRNRHSWTLDKLRNVERIATQDPRWSRLPLPRFSLKGLRKSSPFLPR